MSRTLTILGGVCAALLLGVTGCTSHNGAKPGSNASKARAGSGSPSQATFGSGSATSSALLSATPSGSVSRSATRAGSSGSVHASTPATGSAGARRSSSISNPGAPPRTPTSGGAPGNSRYPSGVLDLRNWKLTLPIAMGGSHNAAEIVQPQLARYSIDPYFEVNGNAVQFEAPVGGATTGGSGYPRSELREMNGSAPASWSTTSGTNTMVVTEAATHLPKVKSQVVTAQIHNASDDVIEILADGTRSTSPGVEAICLRWKGSSQTPCMDDHYVLGSRYTIKMAASSGHITVFYNGVKKYVFTTSQSGLYFKAGAYTQSNPSKGDSPKDFGRVMIYALAVSHG